MIADLLIAFASGCFGVAAVTILIRLLFRRAKVRPPKDGTIGTNEPTVSYSKVAGEGDLTATVGIGHRRSEAAASRFVRLVDHENRE